MRSVTSIYDAVIRLYPQEGIECTKISRIIHVGETTISKWIRNFADENKVQIVMKRTSSIAFETSTAGVGRAPTSLVLPDDVVYPLGRDTGLAVAISATDNSLWRPMSLETLLDIQSILF